MKTNTNRLLIPLFIYLAALAGAQAVSPPPDGGYPNQTTAEGEDALFSLSFGITNTALGFHTLYTNDYGSFNTAVGSDALGANENGGFNTAVGVEALSHHTCTNNNTAVGYHALAGVPSTCGGSDNVAVGYSAMGNGHAVGCTAVGSLALSSNTGQLNTAIGKEALTANTTGGDNTALGWRSLFGNVTGNSNTVAGLQAMFFNTTGSNNVALGYFTLGNNRSGSDNIALGTGAGTNLTTGNNNIDIGNAGVADESDTIRIGTSGTQTATYIAGITKVPVCMGHPVVISPDGQLGVKPSSGRFKEAVESMDETSEAILSLRPVTFHYKKELDPEGTPQFGLVAEEVAKVNPGLVARDEQGKPYTVRYEAVNAMLLNEFLKAHRKMEQQEATIVRQQKQIDALTAGLQKVSVQLELKKPASKTALNNQ